MAITITLNLNSLLNLSQSPAFSADNFKKHTKKLLRSYALEAQRSYVRAFSKERDPITDKPCTDTLINVRSCIALLLFINYAAAGYWAGHFLL